MKALLPAGGQVTRASCGHVVSGERNDFWRDHGAMNVPLTPKAEKRNGWASFSRESSPGI